MARKIENTWGVTKYTLSIENNVICLRAWGPCFQKGYTNLEAVRKVTGKSIPGLRKEGAKRAKMFSVPFIDKTL